MYSPEQFVPQTPTLFNKGSQTSPCATVPDFIDALESQDNLDNENQEANVPRTPNIPLHVQTFGNRIIASPIPVTGSQLPKMHYGTPLLELVLLKSARKHASENQMTSSISGKNPGTPLQEQTVPGTPKILSEQTTPKVTSDQKRPKRVSPCSTPAMRKSQSLELFNGDEIFPRS